MLDFENLAENLFLKNINFLIFIDKKLNLKLNYFEKIFNFS